jgi:hypothetical protein
MLNLFLGKRGELNLILIGCGYEVACNRAPIGAIESKLIVRLPHRPGINESNPEPLSLILSVSRGSTREDFVLL